MARERDPQQIQRDPVRAGNLVAADRLGDLSVEISRRGVNARREYLVDGLTGTTSVDGLLQAIRNREIPLINTFDAKLLSFVSSIRAEYLPGCNTKAKVIVNWGPEDDTGGGFNNDPDDKTVVPNIIVDVTLQTKTSMFDADGKLIIIADYVEEGDGASELKPPQTGEVDVIIPMFSVVATRLERNSPGLVKSPGFSGKINADSVFGDPRHFWLAAIGGRSTDSGQTYQVTYTFQRNVETWNALVVWRDPATGRPGKDVTKPADMEPGSTGNGSLVSQIYSARPFRGDVLELPDSFWGAAA